MTTRRAFAKMFANISKNDKKIYPLCIFYTLLTIMVPFFPVLLPKFLIQELLRKTPRVSTLLLIVGMFFFLSGMISFLSNYLLDLAYPRLTKLRIDYVRNLAVKLMTMDLKYTEDALFFDKNEKALEATNSNNNGVEAVYHNLFRLPACILTAVFLSVFIGQKSILILFALLLHILTMFFITARAQQYEFSKKEAVNHAMRRVHYYSSAASDFAYGKDLRLYKLKDRLSENYQQEINSYVKIFAGIKNREFLLSLLSLATLLISDAATYGILIKKVLDGMTIADFSMYLTAVLSLTAALNALKDNLSIIHREMLYVTEFFRLYDTNLIETTGIKKAFPLTETLDIKFDHVTFAYPGTDKNILTDFSFHIPKGQKLAIVGINGAGKTTLVKLMTGLFQPTSGRILINDTDLKEFDKEELYSMFSVVFQDINILAFTVAQNVACSCSIDRKRVCESLKQVGLLEKIESLEKGIDTMMLKVIDEKGTDLSGGQRQKLAIARALYKEGNMVIMDEPTASLDALAEAEIYRDFSDLMKNKTSVFISHRLSSTKFCDKIALFDAQGLCEYGTHDELMALKKKYYEMFTVQGKYYQTEGGQMA